jgi:hypothetical protein
MLERKNIYRGRECIDYDYFMSLREDLIKDFFKEHPDFSGTQDWGGDHYTPGGWTMALMKYDAINGKEDKAEMRSNMADENYRQARAKYPTAYEKIMEKYGDNCIVAAYTILWPGCILKRHTGDENRDGYNIRIHIPLIVPEGDVGMEVYGEEVDWSDLFMFDNQKVHSVWNHTDKPRLIFLFDIKRKALDLPQGTTWTQESEDLAPRFPKTE